MKQKGVKFILFLIAAAFIFSLSQDVLAKKKDKKEKTEQKQEEAVKEEAADIKKEPTILDKFPPDIQVFKWGEQFRIQVTVNPDTPKEKVGTVSAIKLEKVDGTFLGYRPFNPNEPRQAIFITDPAKIQVNEAKLTIETAEGEFTKIITLEHPADNSIPIEAPLPAGVSISEVLGEKKEKSKKKGWLW